MSSLPLAQDVVTEAISVSWASGEPVGVALGSTVYVNGDHFESFTNKSFVLYSASGALLTQYAFPQVSGAYDGPITPWCNSIYRGGDGTFAVSSPGYFLTQNDQPAFWANAKVARFSASGALLSTCLLDEYGGSLLSVGMASTGVIIGQDANNVIEQGVAAPPGGPATTNDDHPKLFTVNGSGFSFVRYTSDGNVYVYLNGIAFHSNDTFATIIRTDPDSSDLFTINRLDTGFNVVATSDLTLAGSDYWWLGNFSPDERYFWVIKNGTLYYLDGLSLAVQGSFTLSVDYTNINSIDVHGSGDILVASYDQTVAVINPSDGTTRRTIDVSTAITNGGISQVAATGAGVTVATIVDQDNFNSRVASYKIDGTLAWQQSVEVNFLSLAIRKPKKAS